MVSYFGAFNEKFQVPILGNIPKGYIIFLHILFYVPFVYFCSHRGKIYLDVIELAWGLRWGNIAWLFCGLKCTKYLNNDWRQWKMQIVILVLKFRVCKILKGAALLLTYQIHENLVSQNIALLKFFNKVVSISVWVSWTPRQFKCKRARNGNGNGVDVSNTFLIWRVQANMMALQVRGEIGCQQVNADLNLPPQPRLTYPYIFL